MIEDPWRNRVQVTGERLRHILEHPEMHGQTDKIAQTLAEPDCVVQSRSDEHTKLFFRLFGGLEIGDKYLCVVVKYRSSDAFVVTAFFTDKLKRGPILWRK